MIKPVCVSCQRFYRPHRNGIYVSEQMPTRQHAPPGKAGTHYWGPYKVWMADQWRCPGCGHEIVVGSGPHPVSEHHMDGFEDWHARVSVTVNDC